MIATGRWDDKSWADVLNARERIGVLLERLSQELISGEPSRVAGLFRAIAEAAEFGEAAAQWCEE